MKSKKVNNNTDNIEKNVKLSNVELTPVTIGKVGSNKSGLGTVLALFGILLLIIFGLPYIMNLFEEGSLFGDEMPTPSVSTPSKPTEVEPPQLGTVDDTLDYLDISSNISKKISGYVFQIVTDTNTKTLKINVTNSEGSVSLLKTSPIFVELYSSDKMLIDRIMIDKKEIMLSKSEVLRYTYSDVTGSDSIPQYIVLTEKSISDYPAITLSSLNSDNVPYLTCKKNNESLNYYFESKNNSYYLTKIEDNYSINDSNNTLINTYEAMANTYNTIDGVKSSITPDTNSFSFKTSIDLSKVDFVTNGQIFSNVAYYGKDTEAKTINFELTSSGYTCS